MVEIGYINMLTQNAAVTDDDLVARNKVSISTDIDVVADLDQGVVTQAFIFGNCLQQAIGMQMTVLADLDVPSTFKYARPFHE